MPKLKISEIFFKIEPYTGADKRIRVNAITGPGHYDKHRIDVDHDDCDHAHSKQLAEAIASIPTMAQALINAEATFRSYATIHLEKGTPEGKEKALRNTELADQMRSALKFAGVV